MVHTQQLLYMNRQLSQSQSIYNASRKEDAEIHLLSPFHLHVISSFPCLPAFLSSETYQSALLILIWYNYGPPKPLFPNAIAFHLDLPSLSTEVFFKPGGKNTEIELVVGFYHVHVHLFQLRQLPTHQNNMINCTALAPILMCSSQQTFNTCLIDALPSTFPATLQSWRHNHFHEAGH